MSQKKDPPPPFRLNIANTAARKVDPQDPRLSKIIADAEAPDQPPVPAAAVPAPPPVPVATAPASAPRKAAASRAGQGLTVEPVAAGPAPRPRRRAVAPTVRITVAVDGPLPWEALGDMADVQRNMNLRLTEADLQKLQWLSQCLPGTSIQKICREAIREYVDARIDELLGR